MLSFTIVKSPKSHLKFAALVQPGLSPIIDVFTNSILLFTQLVLIDSKSATEGSKIVILSIVNVVVAHAFCTAKVAINWPFGSEQLPLSYVCVISF